MQFRQMFLKSRFVFQKCDVTLWVKQLLNVAHTIFVVSTTQVDCNKLAIFSLGSILEELED